jgi:hypothetical protein
MKDLSCAVAYPGLPIIFAEGFRVLRGRRLSLHASVGAALTDEREKTRTETIVRAYGSKNSLFVDG